MLFSLTHTIDSYHVYNKKNIEKVKKDEAEADKQAKVNQDRVTLAVRIDMRSTIVQILMLSLGK